MNRGDPQLGWDTDQFPNNVSETALAMCLPLSIACPSGVSQPA